MRGKGEGLAHAVAERGWGSVQRERTSQRSERTRQEARDAVIDDSAMCSNRGRTHASLG
jgi:hypothetical protein